LTPIDFYLFQDNHRVDAMNIFLTHLIHSRHLSNLFLARFIFFLIVIPKSVTKTVQVLSFILYPLSFSDFIANHSQRIEEKKRKNLIYF